MTLIFPYYDKQKGLDCRVTKFIGSGQVYVQYKDMSVDVISQNNLKDRPTEDWLNEAVR
ncbi:MAG: hypothetical protein ACOC80_00755 [Petrotogales bacterium]